MDANALPQGHIIGWAPPPTAKSGPGGADGSGKKTSAAKKNEKRRLKRKAEAVKDNWDDDDEGDAVPSGKETPAKNTEAPTLEASIETLASEPPSSKSKDTEAMVREKPKIRATGSIADRLANELEKLDVRKS
jgi:partner of Y14 and mago protein